MTAIAHATLALARAVDAWITQHVGQPVQVATFATADAVASMIRPLANVDMIRAMPVAAFTAPAAGLPGPPPMASAGTATPVGPAGGRMPFEVDFLVAALGDESVLMPHQMLEAVLLGVVQRPTLNVPGTFTELRLAIVPLSLAEQTTLLWSLGVPSVTATLLRATGLSLP